jgi:hypothetical protein
MPHPQPINSVSTVMAKKRSAPPTSYEAFFHGLGQLQPDRGRRTVDGNAPIPDLRVIAIGRQGSAVD